MQISNNIPSLMALRQPSRLSQGQDNQNLVFLYPILISSTLSKYTEILRDFLSVEFISQIKISNGLNITSKISKPGTIGIGDNSINPALEVRKSINYNLPQISSPKNVINDDYSNFKNQQKLNQFSQFFKKQIEINPRYRPYNPVVTTILADQNYLVFPLIVGTKTYQIDTNILFYILSLAMILDLPLNSTGNLERILTYLDHINLEKFNTIFGYSNKVRDHFRLHGNFTTPVTLRSTNPNLLNNNTFKFGNLQKNDLGLKTLPFKRVLDFSIWNAESDHLMNQTMNLNMDSVPIIQTATQKRHFEAAMNSFNAYIAETIIPILYGLETILGPTPAHINYHAAVQHLLDSITKNMDRQYIQTADHIRIKLSETPPQVDNEGNPIYNLNTNIQTKFQNTQFKIDDLKDFCQNNTELIDTIKKTIYNELTPHIKHLDMQDPNSLSSFCDSIIQTSSKFKSFANSIESWAVNAIPGNNQDMNIQNQFDQIKQHFHNAIITFFETPDDPNYALFDKNIDIQNFTNRYSNFSQIFCQNNNPQECKRVLIQIMTQFEQAIEDILFFFFIWNFMSYICGYINEVDIDIQIQKKDVLDFPNYTLILPIEIFKFLYAFYTSNRLKEFIKSKSAVPGDVQQLAALSTQSIQTFTPTANLPKIIEILNDRLKIPNIMVIDPFKDELYYQFMYMKKPSRTKIDNLLSYINNQKDILTSN